MAEFGEVSSPPVSPHCITPLSKKVLLFLRLFIQFSTCIYHIRKLRQNLVVMIGLGISNGGGKEIQTTE